LPAGEAENPPQRGQPVFSGNASLVNQDTGLTQPSDTGLPMVRSPTSGFHDMVDIDVDYANGVYFPEEEPELTPNEIEAWLEQVLSDQSMTRDAGSVGQVG